MSEPDIFLSYSREDRAAAQHFAECFVREGFSVWWDAALRSGQTFDEVIEKELRAAKAVVVLWSPRSVASRWVRAEATLADRRNKLVPAIIEACDRPIIFELTHAADLADWTGDTSDIRWRTLVNDLGRLVQSATSDEEAARPQAPKPAAKPNLHSPASPAPSSADGPRGYRAKPSAAANVDDLDFAPRRRGDTTKPQPEPEEREQLDHTQFYKRSDALDRRGDEELHCLQRLDEDPESGFVVTAAGVTIGRSAPADIILADSGVSRVHCVVELAGHRLRVMDMNSTNGTYVDGKRIDGVAVLAVGAVLSVGQVSFTHEVRTRAELQLQGSAANVKRETDLRVARLARSS